ncbi:manganese efflux pump MntP family protein [Saliterribacillus persicus]|uniref:Putative manganese efflux pump MntP n=1 Tax=Saliterribacillus persicus TaxID=930114 RepID=A0A368YDM8_9BACI|nr:manganese efflux pump [Saliterribacillus persicus]RCW77446.1 putative Mn2+ efflux pump MntP [Saliterribacillus persicus]
MNQIALEMIGISIALAMDAFSASLGIGLQPIRLKRIFMIGLIIGVFHIIMPLLGLILGTLISSKLESIALLGAGLILCAIGVQMILHRFFSEHKIIPAPVGTALLLFALSVSLDSFSVGISLGLSGTKTLIAILMFGITATLFTWCGLIISKKTHHYLGNNSELLGGSILFAAGLHLLFG